MSSKRHLRRRACRSKARYNEREDAKRAAWEARQRTGSLIWPYGCRWCKGYHIGHPPKEVIQSVRAKGRL